MSKKQRTAVTLEPDDALADLMIAYHDAKAKADAATEVANDLKDKIKAKAMAARRGDIDDVFLAKPGLPTLVVARTVSWRVNTPRLKAERPEVYAAYAVQSESFSLKVV